MINNNISNDRIIVLATISAFLGALITFNFDSSIIFKFLITLGVYFYLLGLNFTLPAIKKAIE